MKPLTGMREESIIELLGEINRNLKRIADALDIYNNAAIRNFDPEKSDGQIEIFVTNHES